MLINSGISDNEEELNFFRNTSENAGGNSFLIGDGDAMKLKRSTLAEALKLVQVSKVGFIEIDIEGFEFKVLKKYFEDTKYSPDLKPEYLLVKILEGPLRHNSEYERDLLELPNLMDIAWLSKREIPYSTLVK